MTEFFHTTMIGAFRTNFGEGHNVITIDIKFLFKKIDIPKLEEGHVQANM